MTWQCPLLQATLSIGTAQWGALIHIVAFGRISILGIHKDDERLTFYPSVPDPWRMLDEAG